MDDLLRGEAKIAASLADRPRQTVAVGSKGF
jgi:hypothetical protein